MGRRTTTWMGSLEVTRRQLLAVGAVGAASAMVATRPAGASRIPFSLTNPAGRKPFSGLKVGKPVAAYDKIEHIVIVMTENHSFDNLLGSLGRGDGLTFAGGDTSTRAKNSNPNRPTDPSFGSFPEIRSFKMPTTTQMAEKPSQAWGASWTQFYGTANPTSSHLGAGPYPTERNSGFVISDSGPVAMGYYTDEHVPFLHSVASSFPLADRWFGSCMAQTYPNRRFMMGGTALGQTFNDLTTDLPVNGTILQALTEHGITWKNYFASLPSALIYPGQIGKGVEFFDHLTDLSNFFTDAKNGTLPSVSIVDPDFERASGENPEDVQHHDAFLHDVVTAVTKGKHWKKTLLLYTYDEHGGYYDHVVPPAAPVPDASSPRLPVKPGDVWQGDASYTSFGQLGFRVPAGVVSAYAKPNYVTSTVFDHTSIMKLIEMKWNFPPFTPRDAWAADPWEMVDLNATPAFLDPSVAGLSGPPIEFGGTKKVSASIAGRYRPTHEESDVYPNDGRKTPQGRLRRLQYYQKKNGDPIPANGETPFYAALRSAWEST